jgi:gamma-glutamylcyclotransferase (GGCT)/AIG2-like uncharacterized protein YtfP
MDMSEFLFAYGTLQPGYAPAEIAPAVEKLLPVGEAFVHGVLYDLGGHPGAVLNSSSQERIFGTVYELPEMQVCWLNSILTRNSTPPRRRTVPTCASCAR